METKSRSRGVTRREMLRASIGFAAAGLTAVVAACAPAAPSTPQIVEVTKVVEKPVEVTKVVEKEKVVEKPVEVTKVVEKVVTPTAKPAVQPGGKAKLVWFVRANEKENAWEEDTVKNWLKQQSASDVETIIATGAWTDMQLKKNTMLAAGEEVSVWSPAWVGVYGEELKRGLLHDLTDVLKADNYDWSDIDTGVYKSYEVQGHQYGMPLLANMALFVYNVDLWQAAGVAEPPKKWGDPAWTHDEAVKRIKAASKVTDDPQKSVYGTTFTWHFLSNLSRGYNGANPGEAGDPWTKDWWNDRIAAKAAWDSPEVINFLKWRQQLIKDKVEPNPEVADALGQLGDPFLTGRLASAYSSSDYGTYAEIKKFKWSVAPLPHLPGKQARSHLYIDNWSIGARTKFFDQSWQFMKYLTSADVMKAYSVACNILVPRRSLWDLWIDKSGYGNKAELKQIMTDCFANSYDSDNHHFAGYTQYSRVINQAAGLIWTGKQEPEAVAKTIEAGIEQAARQVKGDLDRIPTQGS